MSYTVSPNMNLQIPGVGTEPGPNYAQDVNNSLTTIDAHNHTTGQGVQIPVAGLNINADLSLGGYNLTNSRALRFAIQTSEPSTPSDLGELYVQGVDLYYIDVNGNNIRMTQSGSVAGPFGTITGLPSGTASASYSSGTFTFQSMTNTPATIDGGNFIVRNLTYGSNGITIQPPSSLPSNYSLVLPALPAQQNIMTLDSSGNITAPWNVDGSTIVVSSNLLQVPAGGITTTQIAANTIVGGNIAAGTITGANIGGQSITNANIAIGAVSGANIAAGTITDSNIAVGTLTVDKFNGSSVGFGYYVPTATLGSGTNGVTPYTANVIRMGNIFVVSGMCNVSPTVAVGTVMSFTLNVPAGTAALLSCGGSITATTSGVVDYSLSGAITANGTDVTLFPISIGSTTLYSYIFQYTQ